MDIKTKTKKLKDIKDKIVDLEVSPLYEYRIKNNYFPVIGEGNHNADLIMIGEAPGKNEALTGRPFCGRAGRVLDDLLKEVDISRKNIYITNIVKDRPPQNRDPEPKEIEVYAPFLDKQIKIIEPKVIVTLGRFSANYILNKFSFGENFSISAINGKVYSKKDMDFKIIPLLHPAAIIYSPERKDDLIKGFNRVKKEIKTIDDGK